MHKKVKVELPRWISADRWGKPRWSDVAQFGLVLAVEIAVIAEGVPKFDGWTQGQLIGVVARLGALYRRLQMPDRAFSGDDAAYYECFASVAHRDICPDPPKLDQAKKEIRSRHPERDLMLRSMDPKARFLLCHADDPPLTRMLYLATGAMLRCPDPRLVNHERLTGQDVAGAIDRVQAAYQEATPGEDAERSWSRPESFGVTATPFDMLRMCVAVLRTTRFNRELASYDVDALMLLWLSAEAIRRIQSCRLCFRWAMPGHRVCDRHSLSKQAGGTKLGRQHRYDDGQAILRLAGSNPQTGGRPMIRTRAELIQALSQVVWPSTELAEMQGRVIAGRLRGSPCVAQAIDYRREMTGAEIIASLQREIDPMEYRAEAWASRLTLAESWLMLENMPPKTRMPWLLACRALEALPDCEGKSLCSRLAAKVGKSPSAFRHFLQRHQDVPIVRELAVAIRLRKQAATRSPSGRRSLRRLDRPKGSLGMRASSIGSSP